MWPHLKIAREECEKIVKVYERVFCGYNPQKFQLSKRHNKTPGILGRDQNPGRVRPIGTLEGFKTLPNIKKAKKWQIPKGILGIAEPFLWKQQEALQKDTPTLKECTPKESFPAVKYMPGYRTFRLGNKD